MATEFVVSNCWLEGPALLRIDGFCFFLINEFLLEYSLSTVLC